MNNIVKLVVTETFTYNYCTFYGGCILTGILLGSGKFSSSVNVETLDKIFIPYNANVSLSNCFRLAYLIFFWHNDFFNKYKKDTGFLISSTYLKKNIQG